MQKKPFFLKFHLPECPVLETLSSSQSPRVIFSGVAVGTTTASEESMLIGERVGNGNGVTRSNGQESSATFLTQLATAKSNQT